MRKLTNDEAIERIKSVQGNRYGLEKVNYVDYNTPICLICPIHGEIYMTLTNIMKGKGCFKCFHENIGKFKTIKEDVIKKVEMKNNNRYEILKYNGYRNIDTIELYCHKKDKYGNEHGKVAI